MNGSAAGASVLGLDPFAVSHFAFVHAQAEAALGVGANPSLENHRSALLAVVRKWNQGAIVTLLALRQLHHTTPPVQPANARPSQKSIRPIKLIQLGPCCGRTLHFASCTGVSDARTDRNLAPFRVGTAARRAAFGVRPVAAPAW